MPGDDSLPDPPATELSQRVSRGDLPQPPGPIADALQQVAAVEQQLDEQAEELLPGDQ